MYFLVPKLLHRYTSVYVWILRASSMFGVLVDVSASMKKAYALNELHHDDVSVERTHAVFTTIAKIVEREVTHHDRRESIFACAFGLSHSAEICNLIELFANLRGSNESQTNSRGREEMVARMVELAKQNGAPHAEEWIREYLTGNEAELLYWLLRIDESLLPILIRKLPTAGAARAIKFKCKTNDSAKNSTKKMANSIRSMFTGRTKPKDKAKTVSSPKTRQARDGTRLTKGMGKAVLNDSPDAKQAQGVAKPSKGVATTVSSPKTRQAQDGTRLTKGMGKTVLSDSPEAKQAQGVAKPSKGVATTLSSSETEQAPIDHLYVEISSPPPPSPSPPPPLSPSSSPPPSSSSSSSLPWLLSPRPLEALILPPSPPRVALQPPQAALPSPRVASPSPSPPPPRVASPSPPPPRVASPSPPPSPPRVASPSPPPSPPRVASPSPSPPPETSWDRVVKSSEAYTFVKRIISEMSSDILARPIEPRSVQYVSQLMVDLMESGLNAGKSSTKEQHDYIQELIDKISPFIYGDTPLCKAMKEALRIFKQVDPDTAKVLFILSDGDSSDGDPLPIARELRALGVRIITCYLTSDHIDNQKRLLDGPNPYRDWGKFDLYEMSSTMKNTHTPLSYLVDAGWNLPPSGESRLFVRANSLDIVNELCEIVVSHMTEGCDALVDVLGSAPLATYINQTNADFIPKHQQEQPTCYAHAIAATFHLAMHRIVGREGGIPSFEAIRDHIIEEYGKNTVYGRGVNTVHVLEAVCPEYRLHYKAVTETDARKAINERRPVVARFRLYPKQWDKFHQFFSNKRKKILERIDLETGEYKKINYYYFFNHFFVCCR